MSASDMGIAVAARRATSQETLTIFIAVLFSLVVNCAKLNSIEGTLERIEKQRTTVEAKP